MMSFLRKLSIKPQNIRSTPSIKFSSAFRICWNSTLASKPAETKRPIVVDRELPDVVKEKWKVRGSLLGFIIAMAVSFATIVKYEEVNSPVVTSTLYTLRRSVIGRRELGDNIRFASFVPFIHGKIQGATGLVDVGYYVTGDKGEGFVHFEARRAKEFNRFVVVDWSLISNGVTYNLMNEEFHPFVPGRSDEPTMRPSKM